MPKYIEKLQPSSPITRKGKVNQARWDKFWGDMYRRKTSLLHGTAFLAFDWDEK